MPLSTAAKNTMLDAFVSSVGTVYASLHTGAPGSTGASEAAGGSPAYARQSLAWSSASGGVKQTSSAATFNVPAGTYSWVGYWSAVTSGTYLGYDAVTPATFAGQDVYTLTAAQINLSAVASA